MPTRLKRPSKVRRLAITAALVGAQIYLGYHAIGGQFGLDGQRALNERIEILLAQEAALDAEVAVYKAKIALFDPMRLDPDILTERARELLGMARPDEKIVVLDRI